MLDIVQALVNGLITGSVVAIGAVGLTLVYGILRLINFAHGELLTIGAYGAFVANVALGLPIWAGLLAAVALAAVVGLGSDFTIWRPLRRRAYGRTQMMLMSLGLSLFLRSAVIFIWGSEYKQLNVDRNQTYFVAGISISFLQIVVIATSVITLIAIGLLLRRTRLGKMMRALASNAALGEVAGIDTDRIVSLTWLLAGGLGGLAGALTGVLSVVEPNMGFFLLLLMFAAVIFGGIGDAYGTLAGGLILGVVQSLSTLVIPSNYAVAVSFLIMVAVLVWRPRGLFGRATAE